MWVRLWVAFGLSAAALSQHTNTRLHQSGSGFEWGWQLTPGTAAGNVAAVGQYYVKLPQSEQRVLYTADKSGYHGAVAVNSSTHSSTFALGQKAIELHAQQTEPHLQNTQSAQKLNKNEPIDIYLLQQQFGSPLSALPQQFSVPTPQPEPINYLASATNVLQFPNYYYNHLTPLYNIQTHHPLQNNEKNEYIESSQPLTTEAKTEQTIDNPAVQVFKDHNCSDDKNNDANVSKELETDLKKSKQLFAEAPSYEQRNINGNFGVRNKKPLTYRGQVSFRVETPKPIARTERFYYTTEASYTRPVTINPPYNATEEGINRLVASTQDLITNEDLLRINNAIEQHLRDQNDDLIKPSRYSGRNSNVEEVLQTAPTMITVKAKIANILKGEIEQTENNPNSENVLKSNSKDYRFSSPIIVAEAPDTDVNSQILDNVVSTVVPYIENGYEFIGIKSTRQKNQYSTDTGNSEEGTVNVTPRPIGTNYLAPITVALRLLNSNENDTFNYIEDHEAADSELISDTVEKPKREKTVVEIQESIPVSITHINDVEVHEYMDEGRSNDKKDAYDFAKTLYNNYVESVRSSKKIQDNMNKILLYKFGDVLNSQENNDDNQDSKYYGDSKEQLEPSENIQTQVEISPNGENHQRSERISYYRDDYGSDNQKIIQPIIIEKEVPVTKFVDRYIEKQVPYPETVTVPVPVDRPVPYKVEVEKFVEKPVEVTKYVDNPYPVEVPRPYPVEVKVPYPVQQKVYVDRPVHVPYPVEKVVEKSVMQPVAVPTPVAVPVEVPYPVEHKVLYPFLVDRPVPVHIEVEKPVDRIVEKQVPVPYAVEKRVPYPVPYETKVPVPYPVERRVPVPVDRIVEKPVTVTKVVEKPVHIQVPVPQPVPVHVHHPYPVDRIVEKRVPYPVHIDRVVEKKVNVPYPVEKIVEKIVEKPVVVTKYVDKPYPVEVKVPYPVEKIVEKRVPYAVHVPIHIKSQYEDNKPDYQVAYRYDYKPVVEETRNVPQYQALDDNQRQKPHQHMKVLYEEFFKDAKKKNSLIQSTQWGNQYASSYQYLNSSVPDSRQAEKNQALENYVNYLRNGHGQQQAQGLRHNQYENNREGQYLQQQNQKDYYAQAQGPNLKDYYGQGYNQNSYWDKNKNYLVDVKLRRTDRVPKVTIEYGGFRPPLIPSTEVDLDGVPVKKSE